MLLEWYNESKLKNTKWLIILLFCIIICLMEILQVNCPILRGKNLKNIILMFCVFSGVVDEFSDERVCVRESVFRNFM